MSKTDDIKAELTKLGIAFEEDATLKDLRALLPEDSADASDESDEDGIIVKDPQVLRPVSLPLVVTLPESATDEQKEYVKTLNAYAYSNPEKWSIKKDVLIARLKEIGKDPSKLSLYRGGEEGSLKVGKPLPANVL